MSPRSRRAVEVVALHGGPFAPRAKQKAQLCIESRLLHSSSVARAEEIVYGSERLRLRQLRSSDIAAVAAMVADPDQMRFYGKPKSRLEVEEWLAWNLSLYEEHGFGTWCVESEPEGTFLGYCGIRPLRVDAQREVELAWHIKKEEWNRGVGTEAGRAAVRLGLGFFGLPCLVAMIHPENRASVRVAEKLGMVSERRLIHYGEPTVLYRTSQPTLSMDGAQDEE